MVFFICRLCVIAGNISPIDVITHVPILCEEEEIPYIYVPSKEVSLYIYILYLFFLSAFEYYFLDSLSHKGVGLNGF